ncbi:MAG: hypothetical protein ACAI34_03585 [Verrucomicrobium sp.]
MNATLAPAADASSKPVVDQRAGHFIAAVAHKPLFTESERTSVPTAERDDLSQTVTFSLQEYRILNPQTANEPTLTQSRILAQVLERIRVRELRDAARKVRRQQLLQSLKAALLHPFQTLNAFVESLTHIEIEPAPQMQLAMAVVPRNPEPSQMSSSNSSAGIRRTATRITLPRP